MDKLTRQDDLQLVGQVAAVTGGGRGIGRAIAAAVSAAGATTAVLVYEHTLIEQSNPLKSIGVPAKTASPHHRGPAPLPVLSANVQQLRRQQRHG